MRPVRGENARHEGPKPSSIFEQKINNEEAKEHNIVQQLRVPTLKGKVTVSIDLD